jgi:hypothetical protein
VHVQRLGRAGRVGAPHLAHEGLARHDGARGGDEHAQQVELLGGEVQLALALERAVRGDVDADVLAAQLVLVGGVAAGAPQQRPHAGQQLGEPERLRHVVVGAGVQPDDEVHLVRASGQHEHRRGQPLVADRPGDVEPVHVRQAEVEHDEVGLAGAVDGSLPGALHLDVVALASERPRERLGDRGVVLRQQHLGHCAMLGHETVWHTAHAGIRPVVSRPRSPGPPGGGPGWDLRPPPGPRPRPPAPPTLAR